MGVRIPSIYRVQSDNFISGILTITAELQGLDLFGFM